MKHFHVALMAVAVFVAASAGPRAASAQDDRKPLDNPYCDVPTYVVPDVAGLARAYDVQNKPEIVVSQAATTDPVFLKFLMAHECGHEELGHLKKMRDGLASRSFISRLEAGRKMELEADCYAAKLLAKRGETAVIVAATRAMSALGGAPTGALYPNGLDRAYTINHCAGLEGTSVTVAPHDQ